MKPVRNDYITSLLCDLHALDGELIVGSPTAGDVWNVTSSAVMRSSGTPNFTFYVFDLIAGDKFYHRQMELARLFNAGKLGPHVQLVKQHYVTSISELGSIEKHYVELGYEGVMVRDPDGLYKQGRSTLLERGLAKIKRWQDAEAEIISVEPLMANNNPVTKNALGLNQRSSHQDNMIAQNKVGAFVCRTAAGVEFNLGTGMTDMERAAFFHGGVIGHFVTYKYQGLSKDGVPRFPVFKGFREDV
jgi:DNA ligase-1